MRIEVRTDNGALVDSMHLSDDSMIHTHAIRVTGRQGPMLGWIGRAVEDAFNEAVQRRILALLDSLEAEEAVVNALMQAVEAGADLGSEARAAITALVGLVESDRPTGKTGSVSYRVRDRDSDYKAMCHEDRDHAELLLKAWLADGRDAVIESRVVYDAGWVLEP